MSDSTLLDALPLDQRLALVYARGRDRPLILGLFSLDARLAGIVRTAREPMLAQLKLAWWRDQLNKAPAARPAGDPVISLLEPFPQGSAELQRLVDGWEQLAGAAALTGPVIESFAEGRGSAFAALASGLGCGDSVAEAERAGRNWAMADLCTKLGDPAERAAALELAAIQDWRRPALPRSLRPLQVLHGLARRSRGAQPLLAGPAAMLAAGRIGLLGF